MSHGAGGIGGGHHHKTVFSWLSILKDPSASQLTFGSSDGFERCATCSITLSRQTSFTLSEGHCLKAFEQKRLTARFVALAAFAGSTEIKKGLFFFSFLFSFLVFIFAVSYCYYCWLGLKLEFGRFLSPFLVDDVTERFKRHSQMSLHRYITNESRENSNRLLS